MFLFMVENKDVPMPKKIPEEKPSEKPPVFTRYGRRVKFRTNSLFY